MRLVKAAKASPHAKFYNFSTGLRLGLGLGLVLEQGLELELDLG